MMKSSLARANLRDALESNFGEQVRARVSCSTGKFGLVQSNGEQGEQTDSQTDQLSSSQTIHMAINNAVMPKIGITIK